MAFYHFYSKALHHQKQPSNKADNYEEMTDADAEIVVLLGDETSTEMLVEIAASINDRSKLNTVNLIEIPNQTFLEAIDIDSSLSLKKKGVGFEKKKQIDVSYESLTTHDVQPINNITGQVLVNGW